VGLSEALAREVHEQGVRVSVLWPIFMDTGLCESGRNLPAALRTERPEIDLRGRARAISDNWLSPRTPRCGGIFPTP